MYDSRNEKTRDERLSIRITAERKKLIVRAAKKQNKTISDFVVENALYAAKSTVDVDSHFKLNDKQWQKFVAALDAPPRENTTLRKLLSQSAVFDKE